MRVDHEVNTGGHRGRAGWRYTPPKKLCSNKVTKLKSLKLCLFKLPIRGGGKAMGANHGGDEEGRGNTHPTLGSNKEKRSNLNHTKLEKFVICPINQAFIQDFDPSRGCWLNPGGSPNLDSSPLQVGGLELYTT